MSYTAIKINGQDVGLRFGYPCLRWFIKAQFENPHIFEEGVGLTDIGVVKLIHFAYLNECEVNEQKPTLTFKDFYLALESKFSLTGELDDELTEILIVFNKSLPAQKLAEKTAEAEKKNLTTQPEATIIPISTPSNESSSESLASAHGS